MTKRRYSKEFEEHLSKQTNTKKIKKHENTYTQREWDRVVGYGKVPPEYAKEIVDNTDEV